MQEQLQRPVGDHLPADQRCRCRSGSWPSPSWSTQRSHSPATRLARDCELTEPTALYMQHRIRSQMAGEQRDLLQGIEADETCVGGKPRKTWDGRRTARARHRQDSGHRSRGARRRRGGPRGREHLRPLAPASPDLSVSPDTCRQPCSSRNHEGNSLHLRIQTPFTNSIFRVTRLNN